MPAPAKTPAKKKPEPTFAERMREGLRRMIGGSFYERAKAKTDGAVDAQTGVKPQQRMMGLRRRID